MIQWIQGIPYVMRTISCVLVAPDINSGPDPTLPPNAPLGVHVFSIPQSNGAMNGHRECV